MTQNSDVRYLEIPTFSVCEQKPTICSYYKASYKVYRNLLAKSQETKRKILATKT